MLFSLFIAMSLSQEPAPPRERGDLDELPGDAAELSEPQVRLKRRSPFPSYPSRGRGDRECTMQIRVDEVGKPYEIAALSPVEECPEVFVEAARRAMKKWRWWPIQVDGQRVQALTEVTVHFKESRPARERGG